MLRNLPVPVLALFVAASGCARPTARVTPISQTRLGLADFGPGIISYGTQRLDFALDTSANVIVVRVSEARRIEIVQPLRSGDRTAFARGKHFVIHRPGFGGADALKSFCTPGSVTPYTDFTAAFDSTLARQGAALQTYESCARHEPSPPTSATPRAAVSDGYWLLVVSDVATGATDLYERLGSMEWPDSAIAVVRNLPEALVGGRTTRWAAYYVPVP